ncbi:hypothetical protein D1816_12310 [Aquimarina sp. AD10]|uniref:hypothetical protein n=1 Tax=Aquimarina sp. AD10 TaxID=1714849 RepID=UPI000E4D9566|nr:hypothetical protein [Aquimarina sp. AD10]AXT61097.1 hypothetical protein D1816_12310 [Aquimarina sp. AD10]RKM92152.1 hypothetical protein D7033_21295 [Aquimarina sp. AD10]
MKKIELEIGNEIQGKFVLKDLNLLLVFQVNCPRCFSYALPYFNKLYNEYKTKDISFLALSTAFEDFDKNTLLHTQNLIKDGTLVGETKKMMTQEGFEKLPYPLDFPMAMDKIEKTISDPTDVVDKICNINPNYALWPDFEKKMLQNRVKNYLNSLDNVALTFTLNQLRGTPSFVLFNSNYEILGEWFGHVQHAVIADKINQFLEPKAY